MDISDFKVTDSLREAPFCYDGISQDEYMTEVMYYDHWVCNQETEGVYKPLRKQLEDGQIKKIPEEYKKIFLNPAWDKVLYKKMEVARNKHLNDVGLSKNDALNWKKSKNNVKKIPITANTDELLSQE